MKTSGFLLISLTLTLASGCNKHDVSISKEPINLTVEQKQIVSSSNVFGLNIFKQVATNAKDGENVFVSPLSVSIALSMLYNGADGTTKEELQKALGYDGLTDEQVNIANRDLIKALIEADPKVAMEIANSIWYKNTFEVEQPFLAVNRDYLSADVRSASFDEATKDLINTWVSDKTHKKIKSIVDQIPDNAVMYLINAIYFKGIWQYQFEKSKTQKLDFNLQAGNKKPTDFMVQEGSFDYLQNDLFTAINLPYGSGNFSMLALVPKGDNTCKNILNELTAENWASWNSSLHKTNVKVYLPKFKFSYKRELNDDLITLGMPTMFSDYFANLSRINKNASIAVSKVMHKTFVEVNEEGTEAAAVTSVEIVFTSVGSGPIEFKADKPFVFVIMEKDTKALLFTGIMNEPVVEN